METEAQTVLKILELLGDSGNAAVAEYASWFVWSSFTWIIIGMLLVSFAFKFIKPESVDELAYILIRAAMVMVGTIIIGANIPDLFAPEGMAIHQLIRDVRG